MFEETETQQAETSDASSGVQQRSDGASINADAGNVVYAEPSPLARIIMKIYKK